MMYCSSLFFWGGTLGGQPGRHFQGSSSAVPRGPCLRSAGGEGWCELRGSQGLSGSAKFSHGILGPFFAEVPSGKPTKNDGKSQFLMGKSTISMAIFNSYVK